MRLKDSLQSDIQKTLKFPGIEGFEVTLRYMGKAQFKEIQKKCTTKQFDDASRKMVETVDADKFKNYLANSIILDWKGLTWEGMKALAPIKVPEGVALTEVIAPTEENKLDMLDMSIKFNNWVDSMIQDYINFEAEEKAKEYDNVK